MSMVKNYITRYTSVDIHTPLPLYFSMDYLPNISYTVHSGVGLVLVIFILTAAALLGVYVYEHHKHPKKR